MQNMPSNDVSTSVNEREKVWELIQDIKFTMMVTQDQDGRMAARPMAAINKDENDLLWFFTYANSPKVMEIQVNNNILLSYSEPDDQNYVSISGRAEIVRDQAKIESLWKEYLEAWFPEGKSDPNIALIKVTPETAEYWDNPSSTFVKAFGYAKSKLTGKPEDFGDNKKVAL